MKAPATSRCEQHILIELGRKSISETLGKGIVMNYYESKLVCSECGIDSFLRSVEPILTYAPQTET